MATHAVAQKHKPANTLIDSSNAVSKVNKENGLKDTDKNRSAAAELNFDTFLKLLTVQLQYQDPLNPMEDTEWTTQLAQYSTLEAQLESNDFLKKIAESKDYNLESLAISYIGKDALVKGKITASDGKSPTSINYSLKEQSYKTTIEIREIVEQKNEDGTITQKAGDVIRTLEGTIFEGRNEVAWDGLDDSGKAVEPGYFFFDVSAVDSEGNGIVAEEYTYGKVVATETTEDGEIQLTLNDGRMTLLEDILLVRESYSGGGNSGGNENNNENNNDNNGDSGDGDDSGDSNDNDNDSE